MLVEKKRREEGGRKLAIAIFSSPLQGVFWFMEMCGRKYETKMKKSSLPLGKHRVKPQLLVRATCGV